MRHNFQQTVTVIYIATSVYEPNICSENAANSMLTKRSVYRVTAQVGHASC